MAAAGPPHAPHPSDPGARRAPSRRCSPPSWPATAAAQGLSWSAAALVITLGFAFSRWFTTRYRITDDRVEVGSGLFRRRVRAVSRDRIRTVDVTARAMHRLLGLARVDDRHRALGPRRRRRRAARRPHRGRGRAALRQELLHRREPAPTPATEATAEAPAPEPETELARLDPAWVRYAPFTLSGLVSIGVVAGFLANVANEAHFDPERLRPAARSGRPPRPRAGRARRRGARARAVVAVVVASTVGYALAFWDFRLTRHSGRHRCT